MDKAGKMSEIDMQTASGLKDARNHRNATATRCSAWVRRFASSLFVFAALGTALPAAAQTVITLISNTGQGNPSAASVIQSQPFTTGDRSGGYTLTSVELGIGTLFTNGRVVQIVPTASSGQPDLSDANTFISLSSPASYSANNLNTFTAPANTTLAANTTYHVHIDKPGDPGHNIQRTGSSAEDSGGASGWSIGDIRYWRNATTDSWSSSTAIVKMKVNGYYSINTAPTVANPIPNQTAVVGTTFSYQFPLNTFHDADERRTDLHGHESRRQRPAHVAGLHRGARADSLGRPQAADVGTVSVKVTASDGSASSSDEFNIVVVSCGANLDLQRTGATSSARNCGAPP